MKSNIRSNAKFEEKYMAIYHNIYSHEGFDEAANALFDLVKQAQKVKPGKPRNLYLDIEGHRNSEGGFDADMLELQQDFIAGFLAPFFSEIHCPLFKADNPNPQNNEIPAELIIKQS